MSNEYEKYFSNIEKEVKVLYEIAKKARSKGLDPAMEPESQVAKDLAERVENLVGPPGVAGRIRELFGKISREEIAFEIAKEIIYAKFGHMNEQQAMEQAIRTSIAILSDITAAAIQGVSRVSIKENPDKSRYLAIYFAGPIRSAGGTEPAIILVIGDVIRKLIGLDRYKVTDKEIKRFIEEIRLYEREVARFQYHIADKVLEEALQNLPVEISGVETDPVEVSSFRNIPRIETNRVRGGALRVLNDSVVGRSKKVLKIVETLGVSGWEWLKRIGQIKEEAIEAMYMEDVLAGRPVFSFPSKVGGFRLRYGRARNTGLAAIGVHPATMCILQDFLAIGTQLRIEKPGKAGITVPVDTIEPPIVKLKNGSVIQINSVQEAEAVKKSIDKILFLGDILMAFGEFLENNVPLVPSGFTEEWWAQIFRETVASKFNYSIEEVSKLTQISIPRLNELLGNPLIAKPTVNEAIILSKTLSIPLHPRYTYFWEELTINELLALRQALVISYNSTEKIVLSFTKDIKEILDKLRLPHSIINNKIVIDDALPVLFACLCLDKGDDIKTKYWSSVFEAISEISGILVRRKGGSYIGARMGRPEKARRRELTPIVHTLFPLGSAGGSQRNIIDATKSGVIHVELSRRKCLGCGRVGYELRCPECGVRTVVERICPNCRRSTDNHVCPLCGVATVAYEKQHVDIKNLYINACKRLSISSLKSVKGVKGLISETKIPELLEKGILRSKYDLSVFKDGTTRFDVTNAPLTHFKPCEIGISAEKLRELGYLYDSQGAPLWDDHQLLELRIQDVIIPEKAAHYLVRVAQFLDELLVKVYNIDAYYNVKTINDLIGHFVIGIAPHTLAGVVGRIIGFTPANVCYAHPLWHSAKRRDCDGDEDALILLLDVLLNFSKLYLPERIGGIMDAPFLITMLVNPLEVEDQAHNIDVIKRYPLYFYNATLKQTNPKLINEIMDTISHRLGTPAQFQGLSFTHEVSDINFGNYDNAYMKLKSMSQKVQGQLLLAEKIYAVEAKEVAKRILVTHFIRDIAGNLKAFTSQKFRCKVCGAKFRRTPLSGKCLKCKGPIALTVHKKTIEKYLKMTRDIAEGYGIDSHKERIVLFQNELNSLFKAEVKQRELEDFLN